MKWICGYRTLGRGERYPHRSGEATNAAMDVVQSRLKLAGNISSFPAIARDLHNQVSHEEKKGYDFS